MSGPIDVHAAQPDFELVMIKPGAPPRLPTAQALQYAKQLRSDMQRLRADADLVILDVVKSGQRLTLLNSKAREADKKLDALGPLGKCRAAALAAADEFAERRGFALSTRPMTDTGLLALSARMYGESMVICRNDIDRFEALMQPQKR